MKIYDFYWEDKLKDLVIDAPEMNKRSVDSE